MPAAKGKKVLGLSKWAWVGVIALGVVIFLYMRHRASASAASSGNTDANNGALDEGQLASDIAAQTAASLGGTPGQDTGGFDVSWLADLMQQNEQSLEDFIANQPAYTGAGVASSSAPTVPATTSAGGAVASSNPAPVADSLATQTSGGVIDTAPGTDGATIFYQPSNPDYAYTTPSGDASLVSAATGSVTNLQTGQVTNPPPDPYGTVGPAGQPLVQPKGAVGVTAG